MEPKTVKEFMLAILSLKGPQVTNLLLVGIVALFVYTQEYVIPRHMANMQAGYERIEAQHAQEIGLLTKAFSERSQQDRTLLDRLIGQQAIREPSIAEHLEKLRPE